MSHTVRRTTVPERPRGRGASAGLAVLGLLFAATPARASHYALGDVPTLIDDDALDKLKGAGFVTTEDLLAHTAPAKERKAVAKKTGLKETQLLDIARRCDVLRMKGVGPEMVLVLEAVGVRSVPDLGRSKAPDLAAAIGASDKVKKITGKPPTEAQIGWWIEEAKKLPALLELK